MTLVKPRMLLPSKRTKLCNAVFLLPWCLAVSTAVVVVENGEYRNVLVAVSPGIQINDGKELLKQLQDVLIQSSGTLFKATGISFGDVIVLLPYTWSTLQDLNDLSSSGVDLSTGKMSFHDADILVDDTSKSIFGEYPFTLQDGGCGQQGVRITIPKDFLSAEDDTPMTKGKLLAREWIRYRYGVFDENGYTNDPRYPLYYAIPGSDDSTNIRVNDCTDKLASYVSKDSNTNECALLVDKMGLPLNDADCTLLPDPDKNGNITSSLMYFQDFPNVEFLCDDVEHPHNSMSPNKQNILCRSRSIWSVFKEHKDFQGRSESDHLSIPRIKVVLDRNPRVVIASLLSQSIGFEKMSFIAKTIMKFLEEVPDETEIGFITDEIKLNLTPVKSKKEYIAEKSGSYLFSAETLCYQCSLAKAQEMLGTTTNLPGKGTIVLFAPSDFKNSSNFVNDLRDSELCLVVVYVANSGVSDVSEFKQLVKATSCSCLWEIPYEASPFFIMSKLSEIFSSISQWHSYHNEKFTLMLKEVNGNSLEPFSFSLDPTIGSFQVWITHYGSESLYLYDYSDKNHISFKSDKEEEPKSEIIMYSSFYMVSGNNTRETNWTCTLKNIKIPLFFQVAVIPRDSNILKIRTWVKNTENYDDSENGVQMPMILFAEVTVGIHPVLHAEVVAEILNPTGNQVSIKLLDNGFGDPDITKYDGIYSRYFTKFTGAGDYEVTVTASDNEGKATTAEESSASSGSCCGSFVPIGDETSTRAFIRTARSRFHSISDPPKNGYKPSRIRDLRLIDWTFTSVTLQWTAPGNEMDEGTVRSYDVKMFSTKNEAENKFDQSSGDDYIKPFELTPQPYQEIENLTITFTDGVPRDKPYFFSVRSQSRYGKISDTSNAVQYFVASTPSTSTTPTQKENDDELNLSRSGISGQTIGIIAGVTVGIVLIIVCVYVICYIFLIKPKRRLNENQTQPNTTLAHKPNEPHNENRSNQKTRTVEDGTVTADEWQIDRDPINPIQSWPANVLINHYKKVKAARSKNKTPPTFNSADLSANVKTISNGLLPNPIYSYEKNVREDNEEVHSIHELSNDQPDHPERQKSIRRVTHV